MKHPSIHRLFYALLLGLCVTTFLSCSDDEPSIDLRTICRLIPGEKIKMTLNGETIGQPGDAAFAFPDLQLPEKETFESKMLLEMISLWPAHEASALGENFYFEVDAQSTPDRIAFAGRITEEKPYDLEVEGCYENDELTLNLSYRSGAKNLTGHTYELEMNADAFILDFIYFQQDNVEWNGERVPIREFLRESLKPIFSQYVNRTGNDAARITFLEDGGLEVSFRDSRAHTFTPAPGHYAHRFNGAVGWLETGQEEASGFCGDFMPLSVSQMLPNGLFWCTKRDKAYIPVRYQERGDEMWMTLYLEGADYIPSRFIADWTADISDESDAMMRLREIRSLLSYKHTGGYIWVKWKKVS